MNFHRLAYCLINVILTQSANTEKSVCNPVINIRTSHIVSDLTNKTMVSVTTQLQSGQVKELFENVSSILLDDQQARFVSFLQLAGIATRPKDCEDHRVMGQTKSVVYEIFVTGTGGFRVSCDMETDGGGWTVFQRRTDGSLDFDKNWLDYQFGFGDLEKEFWLGNQQLHAITAQGWYTLRIDMTDSKGIKWYAKYKMFSVGNSESKYELMVQGHSGTAEDNFSFHNGAQFTAKDRDYDSSRSNCAQDARGGWWYKDCLQSNLNGKYGSTKSWQGIHWRGIIDKNRSLTSAEMKIRRWGKEISTQMERNSSDEAELVPQSVEDLEKIIQENSKNKDILIYTWDGNNMQDIPLVKKSRKVNLSKLLQRYESQVESTTVILSTSTSITDELIKKMEELQKRVGPDLNITIEDFENWGKTQRAHVLAAYPETLDQLKRLIVAARDMGLRIRCAGAGHSWAPLFADSKQLLIHMEKMNSDYPQKRKIYMEKNQDNTVDVHIMAGVTNEEFKKFQLDNNVSIPANVILTIVRVVSVIVTGCHGVGKDCNCPSDYVVQMRIVDSNGQLKIYTTETHGEEMMKAVIANFGLFGVVYDMTIRLENAQTLVKTVNKYFSVNHIFYNASALENLVENNWSVELFWFPMNSWGSFRVYDPQKDDVWVRLINKDYTGKVIDDDYYKDQEKRDWLFSEMYRLSQFLFKSCTTFPGIQALAFSTLKGTIYPTRDDLYEKLPEAVHFRKYIEYVPVYDMEFAFDLSEQENYDLIRKAAQFVISEVESEYSKNRCPLNVAMEMRWMSHSEAYLSPASIVANKTIKNPKVIYIEILSLEGSTGWEEFSIVIGKKWMELGGVPHLAKQWELLPNIHRHIREKFGNRIDSFKQQLECSGADPTGIFMNEGLRKLLSSA